MPCLACPCAQQSFRQPAHGTGTRGEERERQRERESLPEQSNWGSQDSTLRTALLPAEPGPPAQTPGPGAPAQPGCSGPPSAGCLPATMLLQAGLKVPCQRACSAGPARRCRAGRRGARAPQATGAAVVFSSPQPSGQELWDMGIADCEQEARSPCLLPGCWLRALRLDPDRALVWSRRAASSPTER